MMTRLVVSQVPFEIKKLLQLLLSNLQSVIWVPGTSVYYDELDPCTYLFKLNDLSIACCTANSCKKEECARDISSNNSSALLCHPRLHPSQANTITRANTSFFSFFSFFFIFFFIFFHFFSFLHPNTILMMMMTIWWSKATRLLEFSLSCRKRYAGTRLFCDGRIGYSSS